MVTTTTADIVIVVVAVVIVVVIVVVALVVVPVNPCKLCIAQDNNQVVEDWQQSNPRLPLNK